MYTFTISETDDKTFKEAPLHIREKVYSAFLKGINFLSHGNFEIAIGCFTTSIGILPLGWMYRLRAIAFMGHKKYPKAIIDCDTFINFYPNSPDGYIIKAEAFVMTNNFKDAMKKFKESTEGIKEDETIQKMIQMGNLDDIKDDSQLEKVQLNFYQFCQDYQQMIINFELEKNKDVTEFNLNTPLTLPDIVALASSQDLNARSMGALLLVDYICDGDEKNKINEMIKCGGIRAISQSLNFNDPELTFYATKAISDLAWIADLQVRFEFVEEGVLDQLIKQLSSNDMDLVGVTVSALALLGRGGTGIDKIILEKGAFDYLIPLLVKTDPQDKDSGYIAQAFTWLSGDIDNKAYVVQNRDAIEGLLRLVKQNENNITRHYAVVALGNICQNPEIWGRPELYSKVSANIEILVKGGLVNTLVNYIKNKVSNSEQLELQYNSLVTLTQLIGFKHVRNALVKLGGERILHPLLTSEYSGIRDIVSKAIRFFRTLEDYGDRMSDILIPKFRCVQQGEMEPPNIVMTQHHEGMIETSRNENESFVNNPLENTMEYVDDKEAFEALSHIMSGLFGVTTEGWNTKDEGKKKKKSSKKKKENVTNKRTQQSTANVTKNVEEQVKKTSNEPSNVQEEESDVYLRFMKEFEKEMREISMRVGWGY